MLQIVLEKPGAFLSRDVTEPDASGDRALVRVHRIGVCGTDLHAFGGRQPFFDYPRVLGHELGVEVVAVPDDDRGISVGDRCAVEPYLNCGTCIACRRDKPNCCTSLEVLGVHVDGGMQPLLCLPVEKLHRSETLSFEQLALVETMAIGAHAVERAGIEADEAALVVGIGPIGLGVIQSLQSRGVEVMAMDMNPQRLAFCRSSLGVSRTVDASEGDIEARLRALNDGDLPLVVFDATGHPASMAGAFDTVAPGGRIVFVGLFIGDVSFHDPDFHRRELTLLASRNATPGTFTDLIRRMEAGEIDTSPWITERLNLFELPDRFSELPGKPGLIKAIIEVDGP